MPCPNSGADLQQFMRALNWMRSSMPMYTALVSPLNLFLETVYNAAGAHTKKAAGKLTLRDLGWDAVHAETCLRCKCALAPATTLAHPRDDKRLCVFTDASQTFWSAEVTQVPSEDLDNPLADQRHEPLAFISGSFKGPSSRWPIVEKEAFAIVETTDRLDYFLLHPNGFSLFCDHRNLQYIFDPLTTNPRLGRHSASKLFRWAFMLSVFRYTNEFLPGDCNIWADLMTRWGAPEIAPTLLARRFRGIFRAPISPSLDSDLEWPDVSAVINAQASATCTPPIGFEARESNSIFASSSGAAWIPMPSSFSYARVFWPIRVPVAIAVSTALSLLYLRICFGVR
jgi:RNase H-like domain found in reverse transcriptase